MRKKGFGSQIQTFVSPVFGAQSALRHLMLLERRFLYCWENAVWPFCSHSPTFLTCHPQRFPSYTSHHSLFPSIVLLHFHLSQASAESNNHRSVQYSAPDLPGESKKITLSPCTPSTEHAVGWAMLGDPAEILISNPNHPPEEHYFFKCYNITVLLLTCSSFKYKRR